MNVRRIRLWAIALALPALGLTACADEPEEVTIEPAGDVMAGDLEMEPMDDRPRVEITSPTSGSTVTGEVLVTLATHGARVEAADNRQTPGRGHHHILIDEDVTPAGAPIPPTSETIIHMGNGAEEYTLSGLTAGEHRVIAVFAYGDHVANPDVAQDTVMFTVAAP